MKEIVIRHFTVQQNFTIILIRLLISKFMHFIVNRMPLRKAKPVNKDRCQ